MFSDGPRRRRVDPHSSLTFDGEESSTCCRYYTTMSPPPKPKPPRNKSRIQSLSLALVNLINPRFRNLSRPVCVALTVAFFTFFFVLILGTFLYLNGCSVINQVGRTDFFWSRYLPENPNAVCLRNVLVLKARPGLGGGPLPIDPGAAADAAAALAAGGVVTPPPDLDGHTTVAPVPAPPAGHTETVNAVFVQDCTPRAESAIGDIAMFDRAMG